MHTLQLARQFCLCVIGATALSACTKPEPTPPSISNLTERVLLRGTLTLDETGQDFINLCHNDHEVPIYIDDGIYEEAKTLKQSNRPLYVEAFGTFTSSSNNTAFNVTRLNIISTEINVCNRQTPPSKAVGNEPNWSVTINNDRLDYVELGQKSQHFTVLSSNLTPTNHFYLFDEGDLTFVAATCKDGMSDSLYGWQVHFVDGDKEQQGCGMVSAASMQATEYSFPN